MAFKRTVYASTRAGRIAAAGMEIALPTGKEELGLGNGYTVFEPFAMWGQMLPHNSFLQMHGGVELPSDSAKAAKETYLRTAVGTTFFADRGFGRAWSPQVEVLWARPEHDASEWDVVPQFQVTLSKIQHVRVAAGARIPVTQREERHAQALVYLPVGLVRRRVLRVLEMIRFRTIDSCCDPRGIDVAVRCPVRDSKGGHCSGPGSQSIGPETRAIGHLDVRSLE